MKNKKKEKEKKEKKEKIYSISEFSRLIDVSVPTLRRWDRKKILVPRKNPTGRRSYTEKHYTNYMSNFGHIISESSEKVIILSHKENIPISEENINCIKVFCDSLILDIKVIK